jgi:hypothetical protein
MSNHATKRTGSERRPLRLWFAALVVIAMLAFPALAAAQNGGPTQDQYKPVQAVDPGAGGGSQGSEGSGGLGGNVGPLPFTGFDVIAMAAVALTVTGIGLALQRAVARESE